MGRESMSKGTFVKGLAAAVVVAASLGTLRIGEYAIKNTSGDSGASSPATAVSETEQTESSAAELSETETAGTESESSAETMETTEAAEAAVVGETDNTSAVSEPAESEAEIAYMEPETYESVYESPEAPFAPGTYTASAEGIASDVVVTVTFDESRILSVDADVSGESAGRGRIVDSELEERILAAQSSNVDSVSGATVTSDAICSAVADCIAQAAVNPYMESETPEAVSESPEAPFVPGTYTASAAGIASDVVVTVTFDEKQILSVDADVSGESAGRGRMIDSELEERILAAQSSEVDAVSGATVTSDAIRAAVADCIAQAQGKETSEPETEIESESESELFTPAEFAASED